MAGSTASHVALRAFHTKVFGGQPNACLDHIMQYSGSPNGALTAPRIGAICMDMSGTIPGDFYICTAIPSTWVKINA